MICMCNASAGSRWPTPKQAALCFNALQYSINNTRVVAWYSEMANIVIADSWYNNIISYTVLSQLPFHGSIIKPNRAKKPRSFRRLNHAELKLPSWAKLRWPQRRIFWPKGGILVRYRSLGVKGFIRNF
jgi:hypothetical protein